MSNGPFDFLKIENGGGCLVFLFVLIISSILILV